MSLPTLQSLNNLSHGSGGRFYGGFFSRCSAGAGAGAGAVSCRVRVRVNPKIFFLSLRSGRWFRLLLFFDGECLVEIDRGLRVVDVEESYEIMKFGLKIVCIDEIRTVITRSSPSPCYMYMYSM
jgi:hypothetical protein